MRGGQQIVSKISKFGNFTMRKGISEDNESTKSGDDKQNQQRGKEMMNSGNGRAPLGQISLNAPPSLTANDNNSKENVAGSAAGKTIDDAIGSPSAKLDAFSGATKKCAAAADELQQQKPEAKKQKKYLETTTKIGQTDDSGGAGGSDKTSTALVTVCRSETFAIYADDDDDNIDDAAPPQHGQNNNEQEKENKFGGGWTVTDENDDAFAVLPSSIRLSPGKENIPPPYKKREIFLNFSSGTDDDTATGSLNNSASDEKPTTKTTAEAKANNYESGGTTTTTTTTDSGADLVEDENSAFDDDGCSDDHYPSEYMTALTHHSSKSANEKKAAKIVGRQLQQQQQQQHRQLKNPMYCAYDADIYRWHLHRERAGRARNYMTLQSDITESMRAVLIDWCVDVVTEFELCPATFFLTVSITDRTLSRVDCPRDKLQLLGAAAVLTASKMHEIYPPTIKDIVHATDDCYTEAQVLRMEKIILKATHFSLGFPLVDSFAEFFEYFAPVPLSDVQRHMMWFLLELSTLNFGAVYRHLPSRLAAAAFLIASCLSSPTTTGKQQNVPAPPGTAAEQKQTERRKAQGETMANDEQQHEDDDDDGNEEGPFKKWEAMEQKTQIMRKELIEPVKTLLKIHRRASASSSSSSSDTKLKAVRKKFSDARHDRVARMKLPRVIASQLCD